MFDLDEARAMLARTPKVLDAWFDGLGAAWLEADEGPDTFRPRDVLGHLIHGERTDWMPRLLHIRSVGEARPFDPFDRVGFRDAIAGHTIRDLLDEFAALRRANLDALAELRLTATDLDARGLHPGLGSVTARQLLATWVTHDLNHLGQVARVMARRHDDAVGPWKEYLGILHWKSGETTGTRGGATSDAT